MTVRATSLGIALGLLTAGGATGCADQQEGLIVLNALTTTSMGCVADPNNAALAQGRLDIAFGSPYLLLLAIQNQLQPVSGDLSNGGIDNSEMQLRTADVRLTSDQIPGVIDVLEAQDPALVDFSVSLAADSLGGGDVRGIFVEVISRAASEALLEQFGVHPELPTGAIPRVNVEVVVHARRTGNAVGGVGDIEAREYIFPIDICVGCLLTTSTCENGVPTQPFAGFIGGECGNAQNLLYAPAGCGDPAEAM